MMQIELMILFGTIAHIYLSIKRKISFKLLFAEGFALVLLGVFLFFWTGQIFPPFSDLYGDFLSGFNYLLWGVSLLVMTSLIFFGNKILGLRLTTFIYVLPWTLTGVYRHLHELLWQYQYWATVNVLRGGFSDLIPKIVGSTTNITSLTASTYYPAVYTHGIALGLVFYTALTAIILLQVRK